MRKLCILVILFSLPLLGRAQYIQLTEDVIDSQKVEYYATFFVLEEYLWQKYPNAADSLGEVKVKDLCKEILDWEGADRVTTYLEEGNFESYKTLLELKYEYPPYGEGWNELIFNASIQYGMRNVAIDEPSQDLALEWIEQLQPFFYMYTLGIRDYEQLLYTNFFSSSPIISLEEAKAWLKYNQIDLTQPFFKNDRYEYFSY